jgi:hypothetical protein
VEHTEPCPGPPPRWSARRAGSALLGTCLLLLATPIAVSGKETVYPRHTRENFRVNMPATVRADHPAILPVAAAIRAITSNPLEQIVMVNDVTHLLVDYDDDDRVYGAQEFHATLDEMLARRREAGWLYLRDDCDGRAVFAAHLLAALGIPWRLEASYWKEHAWVIARVNGTDYDLLDLRTNAPETNRISYKLFGHFFVSPSRRPPPFAWRRAWTEKTHRDLKVGFELGMLAMDSTAEHVHQRFSTDWTERAPNDKTSPREDRFAGATVAGFPYGESLRVEAIASAVPKPAAAPAVILGVATAAK